MSEVKCECGGAGCSVIFLLVLIAYFTFSISETLFDIRRSLDKIVEHEIGIIIPENNPLENMEIENAQ